MSFWKKIWNHFICIYNIQDFSFYQGFFFQDSVSENHSLSVIPTDEMDPLSLPTAAVEEGVGVGLSIPLNGDSLGL